MHIRDLQNLRWDLVRRTSTPSQSEQVFRNDEHQLEMVHRTCKPIDINTFFIGQRSYSLVHGTREYDSLEELLVAIKQRGGV